MNWFALCISSTFFTGFLPGKLFNRPGTGGGLIGSIVGFFILLWALITGHSAQFIFLLIIISFSLGIIFVDIAENFMLSKWGPRKRHSGKLTDHDFNQTNIDEVHGQFIAAWPIFLSTGLSTKTGIYFLIASLIIFRFFDVKKPWPIKNIEDSFRGAYGIMLDDSAAGIMTAMVLWLLIILIN